MCPFPSPTFPFSIINYQNLPLPQAFTFLFKDVYKRQILERALVYINEITDQEGGNVGLCEDFAENFLPEYDNACLLYTSRCV